ncbi:MAG TPA: FMN-binding protein [Candidatus Binatia bacterium]|nr:FMN-binding protein [Candidatus Binatia bacterium]
MPVRAIVSFVATAVGLILVFSFRTPPAAPAAALTPTTPPSTAAPAATPSGAPPSGGGSPTPTPQSSTGLKNGTYTGQNAANFYGPVQVQVVISGGRITDVKIVQQPSDNPQSAYIASVAIPYLRQEVLQAQSAQVQIISGATFDSQSYMQSVQSALDQAHA